MLNHKLAPKEFFSSRALNMRWATYPPPPGSAPGYHASHHCMHKYTKKVSSGSVHIASDVQPRWKSGRKPTGSEVGTPVCRALVSTTESCVRKACIPPIFETATQASTTIIVIFNTNWKRSVTRTPHSPPINV